MMDLGLVVVDLGKKNKKRNGDFRCGLLWVFDDFVRFENSGGVRNLYLGRPNIKLDN